MNQTTTEEEKTLFKATKKLYRAISDEYCSGTCSKCKLYMGKENGCAIGVVMQKIVWKKMED